jgi:hypothetical protein
MVRALLTLVHRRVGARLLVVTAVVAVVMVGAGRAQRPTGASPNFDIRTAKRPDAANFMAQHVAPASSSAFSAMRADAETALQSRIAVDVVDAPELAVPEIVSVKPGAGFLTSASSDRVGAMFAFLSANASLYGLSREQVGTLEVVADYQNPSGNMAWVELQQRINGIPVFRGLLRGGFTSNGELARVTGQLAAGVDPASVPALPRLTAADAVSLAADNVGWNLPASSLLQTSASGSRVRFARGPLASDSTAWPMYFPLAPGAARLAWATEIWGDTDAYLILVDAEDGTVLFRKNLTESQTVSATYRIYSDDSPQPNSPTIIFPGSGLPAPPFVSSVLVTLIGNEAPATFNNLGWLPDAGNETAGNNVIAGLDRDGTNGVDAPLTGAARVFDFTYTPSDAPTTTANQSAEVTDVFYWTNLYHDRLYQLGFTEAARNFQNDNFGRGGLQNDRVLAEVQDSSSTNNANFSTPSDGSSGRMQMFIFTGPNPDRGSGLDHDVVIHELTHGTSNRLHVNGLSAPMSRGMGEGWSDAYARALLSTASEDPNAVYGAASFVTANFYRGIRRFPYAVKTNLGANGKPHNPLTFADIDNNQINLSDGAFLIGNSSDAFEVHNVGEVWATALLEVRARFITRLGFATGNQRFLQFMTDAMKLDPSNPTLLQGRDSLVAAANAGGGTAADIADIWAGFATRGMGVGARVIQADTGLVVEAFDLPGVAASTASLTAEQFVNSRLDPGELVSVSLCITNNASTASGDVTGTLAATGGVTSPSAPLGYGVIGPSVTVCRTFSFTVGAACASKLTATLQIAETGAPARALTYDFVVGSLSAPSFSQNFDGVTAPALPSGWTTGNISTTGGPDSLWTTSTVLPDTAPNRVTVSNPTVISDNVLVSPAMNVPAGVSQLIFRNSYNMEATADGGVLEISVGGGPFQDILNVGGAFASGGYSGRLVSDTSPMDGRLAWTGNSGGYITTAVTLPASTMGQSVVFRWRVATDTGTAGSGWSVDTVSLATFACSNDAPTILAQPQSQSINPNTTATLTVLASGTAPLSYQWFQGASGNTTTPIGGATSASFTTPFLVATTSFWVRVTNGLGSVDSATATVTVTTVITNAATFDSSLSVPRCTLVGGVCDSGPVLLNGRANIAGGPEPNQPNTINNSCADGTAGTFHVDESLDRMTISTLDGTPFAPGKTVRVDVKVWSFSGNDRLDLFSAADAANPAWTLITTLTPPGSGDRTLSANFTLPAGTTQAVRANFREFGTVSPCSTGAFDDRDDLVFAVGPVTASEMITNGNFAAGMTGWNVFEVPDIVHNNAAGGEFRFHRAEPPTTASGQAVVFQNTGLPVANGVALTASFDIGNLDTVRKRISVLVIDADFSDLSVCTFWLAPSAPIRTYQMKTHPTRGWTNASIYFYSASTGLGDYRVDNVSLRPDTTPFQRADCTDPTAPAPSGVTGPELLLNGDFSGGMTSWQTFGGLVSQVTGGVFEFTRPAAPPPGPGVMQSINQTMTAGQILTAQFQLGNSSSVRKRVTVLLHDLDFSDLSACTFWLVPGQPLSTYTMRSFTTKAWANATITFFAATPGPEQATRLDNVSLKRTPNVAIVGTECVDPAVIGTLAPVDEPRAVAPPLAVTAPPATGGSTSGGGFTRTTPTTGDWTVEGWSSGRSVLEWAEPLDLTTSTTPRLQFESWLSSVGSTAEVQVSDDGITWRTIAVVPRTSGWGTIDVDLSEFAGRQVYLRFVFDAIAPATGMPADFWRIDNVVIDSR